jgi:hypothetical protein
VALHRGMNLSEYGWGGSNVVVNLRLRTEAACLAGVDGHVCELQLTPRIFAEAAVTFVRVSPPLSLRTAVLRAQ